MPEEIGIEKNLWQRIREYVAEVRAEMKKVTWPGWPEVYGTTVMVIATTFVIAFYLALCDAVFKPLVLRILALFHAA